MCADVTCRTFGCRRRVAIFRTHTRLNINLRTLRTKQRKPRERPQACTGAGVPRILEAPRGRQVSLGPATCVFSAEREHERAKPYIENPEVVGEGM